MLQTSFTERLFQKTGNMIEVILTSKQIASI